MATKDAAPAKVKKGPSLLTPIFWPISTASSILSFLILSIIASTLIDWLGVALGWWGSDHSLRVLGNDIRYLGENFTTSVFGKPPADIAIEIAQWVREKLSYEAHINPNDMVFIRYLNSILLAVRPFWESIIYSAMTAGVRIFIITLSIVFYAMVFLVTMIDGLVQRELRKEGGGIEHAAVYHHAKTWISRIIVVSPMIYLAWPESINPNWIVLPSACAFGVSVYVTFSTFKKFL